MAPVSLQTSEQRGAHGGQHGGFCAGQCGEGVLCLPQRQGHQGGWAVEVAAVTAASGRKKWYVKERK